MQARTEKGKEGGEDGGKGGEAKWRLKVAISPTGKGAHGYPTRMGRVWVANFGHG